MARVSITWAEAGGRSEEGAVMPTLIGSSLVTQVVAVGTSAVHTDPAGQDGFVMILTDDDVWVAVGEDVVAIQPTSGQRAPGMRLPAGGEVDVFVDEGQRISVVKAV